MVHFIMTDGENEHNMRAFTSTQLILGVLLMASALAMFHATAAVKASFPRGTCIKRKRSMTGVFGNDLGTLLYPGVRIVCRVSPGVPRG